MKAIKIISIINQGGEYSVTTTYNEVDDSGNVVKKNTKAPTYYAVGNVPVSYTHLTLPTIA